MVFSLFGRSKEKADPRKARDAAARPPEAGAPPAGGPNTDAQREIARRTAEKIDKIESEMIAAGMNAMPAPKRAPANAQTAALAAVANGPAGTPTGVATFAVSTSMAIGHTEHADEIHVSGSSLPPELEEAAILFANGQAPAAEATLRQAISSGSLGTGVQQAWLMLFDVFLGTGQKDAFESMSLDYAAQFEQSPPAWREEIKRGADSDKPSASGFSIIFPPAIDGNLSKQLDLLKRAIANRKPAVFEFVSVQKIDAAGATGLLETINQCKANKHELVIANAGKMFEAARANTETGRRDDSQACWMLALEMLRAQGLKQKFDDLSIDYCVTYEVSPPSWEPMPSWIRGDVVQAGSTIIAASAASAGEAGAFPLRGEIIGRMQAELASLRAYSQERHDLVIDCRDLSRLDFVAAGELLNEVVTLRNMGKSIVFVEPNYLVLALMKVMGIHELADIRRRKS